MNWTKREIKIFQESGYYECRCPINVRNCPPSVHHENHPECDNCARKMEWYSVRRRGTIKAGWICGYCSSKQIVDGYVTPWAKDDTLVKTFIK